MADELTLVLEQLADESRPVRGINLVHLSDVPRSRAGEFRAAWTLFSPQRRLELITVMVEQAEVNIHLNFHTLLRELLADADAQVRRLAIDGLWEDERPTLAAPLIRLLADDPAVEVRAAAAVSLGRFVLLGALGEIADKCAVQTEEALRTAWFRRHEVTEVRRRALEGLVYTNHAYVKDLVDSAYYDEDALMRQSAVFAMGRSGDRRWSRFVLAQLDSHEDAMRFEAAVAAGELALAPAVRPLIRLLDDPDGQVREAAALALGKIGGREAKRALESCLRSGDPRLVESAHEALEELAFNSEELDEPLLDLREQFSARSRGQPDDEDEDDESAPDGAEYDDLDESAGAIGYDDLDDEELADEEFDQVFGEEDWLDDEDGRDAEDLYDGDADLR
jgi:hypothetical protein